MSRNKEHKGAAFGGALNGAAAPWVCVLCFCSFILIYYEHLWTFIIYIYIYIYSLYILYIFPKYVPSIFLCVFLNLWSQE